ncbi:MAG: hypothetical protein ABI550_01650 [Ignavibacteriaceae bacterium]
MQQQDQIAKYLLNCEKDGSAGVYSDKEIQMQLKDCNIYVISDLHIGEGIQENFNYTGTENFFADSSFQRFIQFLNSNKNKTNAALIINGDFIDFMRISSFPNFDYEFENWKNDLSLIGINKMQEELKNSINDKEKKYGLKTNDYKSVWKLKRVITGHPEVFNALADWLKKGNKIIILKGNHDLEFFWLAVRNYLRLFFAKKICNNDLEVEKTLDDLIFSNLIFIDDGLLINNEFYIEHGHKFDRYTYSVDGPLLENKNELNIPFGSFFNRYLLNRIELLYPFFDNIRPTANILPILLRERFFLGLRVLIQHVPFMILIIPKKYYRYMFRKFLTTVLALLAPIVLFVVISWDFISPLFSGSNPAKESTGIFGLILEQGTNLLGNLGTLFLSYLFARIAAYFQLEEPSSLSNFGEEIFAKRPDLKIMTVGHTHNPDQFFKNNKKFFNTGTWIPIVETSSAEIRQDKTYTFLNVDSDIEGNLKVLPLQRWNDDACRADFIELIDKN